MATQAIAVCHTRRRDQLAGARSPPAATAGGAALDRRRTFAIRMCRSFQIAPSRMKWGARLDAGEPLLHPADLQPDRRLRGRSARAGRGRAPRDGAAQTVNARDRGSLPLCRLPPEPARPRLRTDRGASCFEARRAADVFAMGYHFFYDSGNDLDALLRAGRATMAVLGIALGLLVYAWSRRLFGATGGIVSVALYAFCPTLLANGPLATSDIAAALFFTASAWTVWALLHAVSPPSVLAAALAVAGLCLSKMSGILVVPMALVLVGIRLADGRPLPVTLRRAREVRSRAGQLAVLVAAAALQATIVLLLVWAFYDVRYPARRVPAPDQPPLDWQGVLPAAGSLAPLIELARRHHLLPEAYLYGLAYMRKYAATRAAFLNGRHSWVGWPSFFPYSLVVKTPLWLLGLVLAGAAGAILCRPGGAAREPARVRRNLYRTAPLWVLLGVYWASAIASHLNIGHRHLLPTYPAMLVLAGGLAVWP